MTAQEAAKACMALVEDACKSAYIVRPWLMEREFAEIISQVTPIEPSTRFSYRDAYDEFGNRVFAAQEESK